MARLTGLEPATPGVTGRYSNQLSYNRSLPATRMLALRSRGLCAALPRVKRGFMQMVRKMFRLWRLSRSLSEQKPSFGEQRIHILRFLARKAACRLN